MSISHIGTWDHNIQSGFGIMDHGCVWTRVHSYSKDMYLEVDTYDRFRYKYICSSKKKGNLYTPKHFN